MARKPKLFRRKGHPLSLSAALRSARAVSEETQAEAGRRFHVSAQTICAWEQGQRKIRQAYKAGILAYVAWHLPGVVIEGA